MSTPDFTKPSGEPFAAPGGPPPPSGEQPSYGQPPAYGQQPYGQPPSYGQQPYGQAPSAAVGPGGEWLGPPLASWGLRLAGYLIDTVLSTVVTLVLLAVSEPLSNAASLIVFLVFGYMTGTTGQTPGRRLMGIKVLRMQDGQVLGAGLGIARQFCHILDAIPLLLGFFWPLWDSKNQTFADKIVSSVVIKV